MLPVLASRGKESYLHPHSLQICFDPLVWKGSPGEAIQGYDMRFSAVQLPRPAP